ncbi:hypothetical protein JCM19232_1057 [Vibrio ishigakensis]|uniref:Uncharacterized protein n=1 Tax=Vibrio ishigakensis TaxID=1481914 RepID=A0A0B8PIC9_9VIBR|nr:hypothetical protein JCM19232_1057 [Vibrio ishigakensis]
MNHPKSNPTIRIRLNEELSDYVCLLANQLRTSPTDVVCSVLKQHMLMTKYHPENSADSTIENK